MTKQELFSLLNNFENAGQQDIDRLEGLLQEYPYFQIAPILQAKIASQINSDLKGKYITKAALFTADRSNLKRLIEDRVILAQPAIEEKSKEELIPVAKETVSTTDLQKVVEDIKKPLEPSASDDLYREVMKNLSTLKSLRKKYEFLEEQEKKTEPEADLETDVEEKVEERKTKSKKQETKVKKGTKTSTKKRKRKEEIAEEEIPAEVDEIKEVREEEEEEERSFRIDLDEQNSLIEMFIKNESLFSKKKPDANIENKDDLSEKSTRISDEIISENLAIIMLNQGKTDKAIEIYKKLIWKFPQKKAYFASRIEELNSK